MAGAAPVFLNSISNFLYDLVAIWSIIRIWVRAASDVSVPAPPVAGRRPEDFPSGDTDAVPAVAGFTSRIPET